MNKTYIYLLLAVLFVFISGCDKNAEINETVAGYHNLSLNIVYPLGLLGEYRAEFNGQDIATTLFQRDINEGELKVFHISSTTPELTATYNLEEKGLSVQLIKLPGKSIELYEQENFITFSTVLSLFDGFTASLNGQQIVDGLNYIKKDDVSGTIEFNKEGESNPVSSIEDVTLSEGDNIIILQASDTEFVQLSGGGAEEPEPEGDHLSKVRFFYTPVGKLNVDSIRLDFIAYDAGLSDIIMDYKSVVVKKGELSPYIELDVSLHKDNFNYRTGFAYSIYNADTDELLEDVLNGNNMFNLPQPFSNAEGGEYITTYKFITYQITNRTGYPSQVVEGLSEKWRTETPTE